MKNLVQIVKKKKEVVLYIFFGALTTAVNVAVYYFCYVRADMGNAASTAAAWFLSVIFAFFTNKLFVFESSSMSLQTMFPEAVKFCGCRAGTGAGELALMYISVDVLHFNGMAMKIITNVIVIVLNYIVSRLFIFKKSASGRS